MFVLAITLDICILSSPDVLFVLRFALCIGNRCAMEPCSYWIFFCYYTQLIFSFLQFFIYIQFNFGPVFPALAYEIK